MHVVLDPCHLDDLVRNRPSCVQNQVYTTLARALPPRTAVTWIRRTLWPPCRQTVKLKGGSTSQLGPRVAAPRVAEFTRSVLPWRVLRAHD